MSSDSKTEPTLHRFHVINRTAGGSWSARCRGCTFWTGYGSRAGTLLRMGAHVAETAE